MSRILASFGGIDSKFLLARDRYMKWFEMMNFKFKTKTGWTTHQDQLQTAKTRVWDRDRNFRSHVQDHGGAETTSVLKLHWHRRINPYGTWQFGATFVSSSTPCVSAVMCRLHEARRPSRIHTRWHLSVTLTLLTQSLLQQTNRQTDHVHDVQ